MGGAPQVAMCVASQILQVISASQTLQVFCFCFANPSSFLFLLRKPFRFFVFASQTLQVFCFCFPNSSGFLFLLPKPFRFFVWPFAKKHNM
jgi:hypothetical protein